MGLRFQEPGEEKVTKTFKQSEKAIAAQEALMKAAKERAAAAAAAKAAQAQAQAGSTPAPGANAQAAPAKAPEKTEEK